MPLELWLDIAAYKIDVDTIEAYLNGLRNIDLNAGKGKRK
jgi:hypothetical protein